MIILHGIQNILEIKKSCSIVAYVLACLEKEVKPGITTNYLNSLAETLTFEKGAIPGFKGYRGFPYSICASVNEQVVHGFPSDKPLKEGDILSIDFGILYNGWYGDSALTIPVGKISNKHKKLIKITNECLTLAIQQSHSGNTIGDISYTIQQCAEKEGFNVVKNFTGHGIGKNLHEEPPVYNFGNKGEGYLLKNGMVIAIEPMVVAGNAETITGSDGWTVLTKNGDMAAHFEHTIAITNEGPIILTNRNIFYENT
ncbi:type I methionyl aminopeptidase [candidate division WOR-3 bacterium]|nr:type I methionyl aminopeptidase [Candidatus Parcubacteria bacterium]MCK4526447.1 type I methionyl aminopeptidase [candidate division WOR-3 bacterium]